LVSGCNFVYVKPCRGGR
nr:Chain A, Mo1853 [Conus monile]8K3N_A Chain A, Mo1853 [Conus monile]